MMEKIHKLTPEELVHVEGGVNAWFTSEPITVLAGKIDQPKPVIVKPLTQPLAGIVYIDPSLGR